MGSVTQVVIVSPSVSLISLSLIAAENVTVLTAGFDCHYTEEFTKYSLGYSLSASKLIFLSQILKVSPDTRVHLLVQTICPEVFAIKYKQTSLNQQ